MSKEVILALAILSLEISKESLDLINEKTKILGNFVVRRISDQLLLCGFVSDEKEFSWLDDQSKTASLEWMGPRVLAFDYALRQLGSEQTVWPFGLPCLYSTWANFQSAVKFNEELIIQFLAKYRDSQEYNVLVYQRSPDAKIAKDKSISDGTSYLKAKQELAKMKQEQNSIDRKTCDSIRAYLDESGTAWREKTVSSILSNEKVIAHFVIAIKASHVVIVDRDLEAIAAVESMRLIVTGPWPLISFVERFSDSQFLPTTIDLEKRV